MKGSEYSTMSFFYNSLGEFQWSSIAAIFSFVGIIATISGSIYTNKKTLRAHVKSTTKIEWINKIIELSAEYINDYQLIRIDVRNVVAAKISKNVDTFTNEKDMVIYDLLEIQKQQNNLNRRINFDKNISKYGTEFNERTKRINYKANQLMLYFMDEQESKDTQILIKDLKKQLTCISKFTNEIDEKITIDGVDNLYNDLNSHFSKLEELTEQFRKKMSFYLSSELKKIENNI